MCHFRLGVTQELALQSRALHKPDISGEYVTCAGTYLRADLPGPTRPIIPEISATSITQAVKELLG